MTTKIMEYIAAILLAATLILGVGYWHEHHKVKSLEAAQVVLMANSVADQVHNTAMTQVRKDREKHHDEIQEVQKQAPDWSSTPVPDAAACILREAGCPASGPVSPAHSSSVPAAREGGQSGDPEAGG